jgi:hypothetical protein
MAGTIGVLTIAPQKGQMLFNPRCHFYLATYSEDSQKRILLSPELMTDLEIDESADYLIKEIEKARRKAKRELARFH